MRQQAKWFLLLHVILGVYAGSSVCSKLAAQQPFLSAAFLLRGVAKLCADAGVPCLASLEKKMACGLGACLGCTCHTKIGPVTVCKDGPVFNAQEVFD